MDSAGDAGQNLHVVTLQDGRITETIVVDGAKDVDRSMCTQKAIYELKYVTLCVNDMMSNNLQLFVLCIPLKEGHFSIESARSGRHTVQYIVSDRNSHIVPVGNMYNISVGSPSDTNVCVTFCYMCEKNMYVVHC
jgi:hypothetical protein